MTAPRKSSAASPSYTELGIFSVMWSEHCSYKNTRPLLKTFPTKSPKILVGAGEENAGIIDIGDGIAIAFKIESHNHPSAVEPFQGATTGVGGIVRDIFTMGARPVCAFNSLRFGPITEDAAAGAPDAETDGSQAAIINNKRLFAGVVNGIAHYGNCFGIPTIAGEVYFDKTYQGNPLVNAFCLGVLRHEQITRGAAQGVGNPVFYVGPATGRDGLAGAAFASQDLTEESAEQQRGAVQVGDPFMEKLVCEACLELLATGAVAGMQDMGAAGLTCSTCETAARAGTGIEIELDKVPQRAPNMSSYEIMLSESQERMLIVVHKGREEEVKKIFDKWDLPWSEIGVVTDTGHMVVRHGGRVVADIPAKKIADESPMYHREAREPAYLQAVRAFRLDGIADTTPAPADVLNQAARLSEHRLQELGLPPVRPASARRLGGAARQRRGGDPHQDGFAARDERGTGGQGGRSQGVGKTDRADGGLQRRLCVFGSLRRRQGRGGRGVPQPGLFRRGAAGRHGQSQHAQPAQAGAVLADQGIRARLADACRAFDAPVTGGNCSLYNQNPAGPIDPTPTISVVGLIDKPEYVTTQWFKDEGDAIVLLGQPVDLDRPAAGPGRQRVFAGDSRSEKRLPPRCDLETARTLHTTLLGLIQSGW
jgi:phosphoribosylformylglycinamidine (FGAM) synthase-like enzyme